MTLRQRSLRWAVYVLETLDSRLLLSGDSLTVALDPTLDQFGDQIQTVQSYGDPSQAALGIFDTGASAVTFASSDQASFQDLGGGIPIKVSGGASADGIGGTVTGDVSEPGTILADGIHAAQLTFDSFGFPVYSIQFDASSAATSGVQAFVGTDTGSPDLPTITGTPILNATPDNPSGFAAKVDMQGATLDFGDLFPGLSVTVPDVHFVAPNTTLRAGVGTTDPVTIPLVPYGADNHDNPGDAITESPNQLIPSVTTTSSGGATVAGGNFLLDTGSQLTVISTQLAQQLGLDLSNPETTITVQGVGGSVDVPGFTLSELVLPRTDSGTIHLTNIPIYVLDVAPGIDGILGMNAFDTASSFIFDPNATDGASLSVTYLVNPDRSGGGGGDVTGAFLRGNPGIDVLAADGLVQTPHVQPPHIHPTSTIIATPGTDSNDVVDVLPPAPDTTLVSLAATTSQHAKGHSAFDIALAALLAENDRY